MSKEFYKTQEFQPKINLDTKIAFPREKIENCLISDNQITAPDHYFDQKLEDRIVLESEKKIYSVVDKPNVPKASDGFTAIANIFELKFPYIPLLSSNELNAMYKSLILNKSLK